MSRTARLLELLQVLRCHRRPLTAAAMAAELGVSTRTIYRDILTLVSQGAEIDGEPGIGYLLRPGFLLPPLMLDQDEVEAVILGLRLVATQGDPALTRAAANAAAKVRAVLPDAARQSASASGLLAGPAGAAADPAGSLATVRSCIRRERRMRLAYSDLQGRASSRVVWPLVVGFFADKLVLAAWCETRADFRHFRLDRIRQSEALPGRYGRRRAELMADWRFRQGVSEQL